MAREIKKLNSAKIRALSSPGLHSDGGGLFLSVSKGGAKSWRYVYRNGKRVELGLGPYPAVSLVQARELAQAYSSLRAQGIDPKEHRRQQGRSSSVPIFGVVATEFVDQREEGWKNAKHRQQWRNTLASYAQPIWNRPVDTITVEDVLGILRPIWMSKHETATRVRGRIERVLDAAKVRGLRSGENPAAWRGNLALLLPRIPKGPKRHHPAMPYEALPAFMTKLRQREGLAARALELLIHTAARTSEILEATWSEFDLETKIWTVPADRMKAGQMHRVPLTPEVLALLKALPRTSHYLFPGGKLNRSLSNMAMTQVLRRMEVENITVHGFRSSFRDWAGDVAHAPREIAETALAHQVGSEVERAYRRGDALEQRRELMGRWSAYLVG